MKNLLFYFIICVISLPSLNAQFEDDMESYTPGQPISGVGPWLDFGCGGGPGCALMSSSTQAFEGYQSGLVPNDGTTDAILDLGNKIFGIWPLRFWVYIPTNKEAYWNMMGITPNNCDGWTGGRFYFNQDNLNPSIGFIDNIAINPVEFSFPHDAWFQIHICFDITLGIQAATWYVKIDGEYIIPTGTPYKDGAGVSPTSLGGINYFSISSENQYYVDDFVFQEGPYWCFPPISVDEIESQKFTISPNPVRNILNITNKSACDIENITIYDLMGKAVLQIKYISEQLDVSSLKTGVNLVKIETDRGLITKKIIKS